MHLGKTQCWAKGGGDASPGIDDLNAAAAVRFSLFNRGGPEGFAASVFPSTMESIVTLAWTPRQLHSHSVRRTCGQVGTEQTQQGALAKRVF